MPIVCKGQGKP